ncbi:MAG: anthranilate synthase component I, partial [Alphaproteobacteria bacterium]|nr:anthranilate synthase component I [Alphaproteobacteria bacterium]
MPSLPDFDIFEKGYHEGKAQLVWVRRVADIETPVSACLKLMEDGKPSFLLESVEGGETRGRYSIIGLEPDLIWKCEGNNASIARAPFGAAPNFVPAKEGAIDSLRALVAESKLEIPRDVPPMASGLVGLLGYDMVTLMERLPSKNPDELGIPDGQLMRPQVMVIFDAVADVMFIVTPVRPQPGGNAGAAYASAKLRIEAVCDKLGQPIDAA